jgi:hypothetical protein
MENDLVSQIEGLLKRRQSLPEKMLESEPDYFDYKKTKAYSEQIVLSNKKKQISKRVGSLASWLMDSNKLPAGLLEASADFSKTELASPGFIPAAQRLASILKDADIPLEKAPEMKVCMPRNIPLEISGEINEDLKEMEACFLGGCYRAATILCGRVLETALHRKYYETTGVDMLEKSPGIGLGNLISKLKAKNISFDPGITQQIHLINQIRIFSVHKKQERFYPTKPQTQAMILYTCDILSKLFS